MALLCRLQILLASHGIVTQPDGMILITPPQPESFSTAFQQTVTVSHGLKDCTAVMVCLKGKSGLINGLWINSTTVLHEQFNFISELRGTCKDLT